MAKTEQGNVDVLYNLGLAYSQLGQLIRQMVTVSAIWQRC